MNFASALKCQKCSHSNPWEAGVENEFFSWDKEEKTWHFRPSCFLREVLTECLRLLTAFSYYKHTHVLQNSSPVTILYITTIKRNGRNVNMNKKQSRHNMKPNIINWKTKPSRKVLKNNTIVTHSHSWIELAYMHTCKLWSDKFYTNYSRPHLFLRVN